MNSEKSVDKVSRYKWTSDDKPGVLMMIDKTALNVDQAYQRDENHSKTLEIASAWSWIACGAIIVGMRGDGFFVIDGQHRVAAAMKRGDIKELPCVVFETQGVREEAVGFLRSNTNRRPIGAVARHRASLASGDEMSDKINSAIYGAGLVIAHSATRYPQIKCISVCEKLARQDFDSFVRALRLSSELAMPCGAFIHERLLSGLFEIDRKMDGGISERFRKRILHVKHAAIIDGINRACAFFARGSAKTFAEGLLQEVNKGLREKFDIYGTDKGA